MGVLNTTFVIQTRAQRMAATPPPGRVVYDSTLNKLYQGDGETVGGVPAFEGDRYQLIANVRGTSPFSGIISVSQTNGIHTSRLQFVPAYSSSSIMLVYTTITMPTATSEAPPWNPLKLRASLQYLGSSVTDQTATRVPVTFSGHEYGEIGNGGWINTDPIAFDAVAGVPSFVYSAARVSGNNMIIPSNATSYGGTSAGGLNNGDGFIAGFDVAMSGNVNGFSLYTGFGPCAILGKIPKPRPAIFFIGDSIFNGGQSGGDGAGAGGMTTRICEQEFNRIPAVSPTPIFPHVNACRPGGTIQDAANPADNWNRMRLMEYCSTVISNLGVNDLQISNVLTLMKSAATAIANKSIAKGKRHIQFTLTPYTDSTDGWQTAANQTVHGAAGEAVRIAFNTWLRDGTFASTTTDPSMVVVWDWASFVEVNSSNVLTLNGGFWKQPPAVAGLPITGTFSSITSSTVWVDSSKTWVQDAYKGYSAHITSGASLNKGTGIWANTTAGQLNLYTALAINPSIGDTYAIRSSYTVDGIHPSTQGHILAAQNFPLELVI